MVENRKEEVEKKGLDDYSQKLMSNTCFYSFEVSGPVAVTPKFFLRLKHERQERQERRGLPRSSEEKNNSRRIALSGHAKSREGVQNRAYYKQDPDNRLIS